MKLEKADLVASLEIAKDLEPEYNAWRYPKHSWCLDSVLQIEKYLLSQGYELQARSPYGENHLNFFC